MIMKAILLYGVDASTSIPTQATRIVHDKNENSQKLNKDKIERFHPIVAKLLFIIERERPDLDTVVSFYNTRVFTSLHEYNDKLCRTLRVSL